MIAISGFHPSAAGSTQKRSLAHDAKDLFMIDPISFPVKLGGNPPVSITAELFNQLFDSEDKILVLIFGFNGFVVIAASGKAHEFAPPLDALEIVPMMGKELSFLRASSRLFFTAFFKNSFSRTTLPSICSNCRTRSSRAASLVGSFS